MTQTAVVQFNNDQLALIRQTVAKGTSPEQFNLFVEVCNYHRLNPFARQIYAVVRGGNMVIQTSIDGYRLLAERSGKYAGQLGPEWCGDDGMWKDVWLSDKPPVAARIGVLRKDFAQPTWGIAKYKSYVQESSPLWRKMPDVMLSKCAESLALRKAFPAEMSGIYTAEEMQQADHDLPTVAPFTGGATVEADPAPRNLRPDAPTKPAPQQNAAPTDEQDQAAQPAQPKITPQQAERIRSLCKALNQNEPEGLAEMAYFEAKALYEQLAATYKAQKQASNGPDAPIQDKATTNMINKAKSRVEAIEMIWGDVKRDSLHGQVEDKDLTVAQYAKVIAVIEQYEQTAKAS
jgi:phage recombination protein Bet